MWQDNDNIWKDDKDNAAYMNEKKERRRKHAKRLTTLCIFGE